MPRNRAQHVQRLESFHRRVVALCQGASQLGKQIAAQQSSADLIQHKVRVLHARLAVLRSQRILARMEQAYRILCPSGVGNSLRSQHGAALDAITSFVSLVANKVGVSDGETNTEDGPLGSPGPGDGEQLVNQQRQPDALSGWPAFDSQLHSRLVAEFACARVLLRNKRPRRQAGERHLPRTRPIDLLGPEDRQVLEICNSPRSINEKLRMVCCVDRRFLGWNSKRLAHLLKTSPSNIRQTDYWIKTAAARVRRGKRVPPVHIELAQAK